MKLKKILGAILVILLVGAMLPGLAMGLSWQDPNIRTITKLNWLDMVSNLSWKDFFIRYNRSENLLECEVQFGANDTLSRATSANECAQMVRANLTMGGNVSVPDVSTPNGVVIFADSLGHTFSDSDRLISEFLTTFAPVIKEMENQLDFNHTSRENHIYFSTWKNGTIFGNWTFLAPLIKEFEDQQDANLTSWHSRTLNDVHTNESVIYWIIGQWLQDPSNRSVGYYTTTNFPAGVLVSNGTGVNLAANLQDVSYILTTAPVLKEAGDQRAENDTLTKGAAVKLCTDLLTENQSTIKGAAVRVCDDHLGTNITTTTDIRLMAYQFVTPASGGAAYSAPVEGGSGNIWVPIDFDGTSSEAAVADILLPSDYSVGFTETYSWTATSAGGGGVVWGTELACISDNVALDASWGTQVLVTDTFQTSGTLHISPASAVTTPSGTCLAGRTLAIRVKRMPAEAGDTMSDDARFLGLQLTYTKAGA